MNMTTTALLLFLLLHFHVTVGSLSVFRPTGGSVILKFQQHQQLERENIGSAVWRTDKNKILRYIPSNEAVEVLTHEDRVQFNKETFSLELKNLEKSDSGTYRGEIIAIGGDSEAEYRLSVLDPVEAPVLSVSHPSCGKLFNVTVTCKSRDLNLTSTCDSNTCYPDAETSSGSTLSLSVRDNIITCKHSNQVSQEDASVDIRCLSHSERTSSPAQNAALIFGIPTFLCLIILACGCSAAMLVWKRRQTGLKETVENPIYSSGEQFPQPVSTDMPIYSTVKKEKKNEKSAESDNLLVGVVINCESEVN